MYDLKSLLRSTIYAAIPLLIASSTLARLDVPSRYSRLREASPADTSAAFATAFGKSGGKHREGGSLFLYGNPRLIWLSDGRAALVSSAKRQLAAHVESGRLSVHYLRQTANAFIVDKGWMDVGGGTSMGAAPGFSLSAKFGANPTIIATGGGLWQGCSSASATLIELTPGGPVNRGSIPLSYDNRGMVEDERDGVTLKGEITHIRRGIGFDVTYHGSRRFTETYRLQKGKYGLARGGESKMEIC
jgi:hypothetical protein